MSMMGYKIISIIEEDTLKTVFKAQAKNIHGDLVVLKVFKVKGEEIKKRFVKSISLWKLLNHPSIVRVFDFGVEPVMFVVTEFMEGNLRQKLERRGRLTPGESVNIALQLAVALNYAHSTFNVIHGDVRPENILYRGDTYKLDNWGFSMIRDQVSLLKLAKQSKYITYSAPEQIDSSVGKIGPWTDIWQLGILICEMMTGNLFPKSEESNLAKNKLNIKERIEEIKRTHPELGNLIERMIKSVPEERVDVLAVIDGLKKIKESLK